MPARWSQPTAAAVARIRANPWAERFLNPIAALLLGAALSFMQAPVGWFWLAPPGLALAFLLFLSARSTRGAAAIGWLLGFGYFVPGLLWIGEAFWSTPTASPGCGRSR